MLPNPTGPKGRWQADLGRWDVLHAEVDLVGATLAPLARDVFGSATLKPSYADYVRYQGEGMMLPRHRDKNACTCTVDVCLAQSEPWGLWVEGTEYLLQPNQALCYFGEVQEHWRNTWRGGEAWVELLLCHFVEPDHWWWSKPR